MVNLETHKRIIAICLDNGVIRVYIFLSDYSLWYLDKNNSFTIYFDKNFLNVTQCHICIKCAAIIQPNIADAAVLKVAASAILAAHTWLANSDCCQQCKRCNSSLWFLELIIIKG